MKKIRLGNKNVELYDAIEDLPIVRFHKYNKMLLIDAGIGSDLADYDRHIEKATIYIQRGDKDKAIAEIDNARQNIYMIQSGLNPRHAAFAVLIKSIDGEQYDDMSDDGIQRVVDKLRDVSHKDITAQLEAVKKKIDEELRAYFPALFDDATVKEYYDKLLKRTRLILNSIITGEITERVKDELRDITEELVVYFNPQPFSGENNSEIKYDKQFENMCLILARELHADVKRFTVLEFYNANEFLKEQTKKIRESTKRR